MSHLALVSVNLPRGCAVQWPHDIRNMLAGIGLHLETLKRLSHPGGTRAADAALALMEKAAALCGEVMRDGAKTTSHTRRRGSDLGQVLRHVIEVLRPSLPHGLRLGLTARRPAVAMVDPDDLFRIMFNLLHNAVSVARTTGDLHRVDIRVAVEPSTATIRIKDDGPGLPPALRRNCFRPASRSAGRIGGYGIAIARELAERNGGALKLLRPSKGTAFALELPLLAAALQGGLAATRSLGAG
jgi:signal transduction histidine kinase